MPKLLLADAAKFYRNRGDVAITKHFLYRGCRAGTLPHIRIGSRFVIDTEQLDEYFQRTMFNSLRQETGANYGVLRRVEARR